jgi:hypothetical protein
MMKLTFVITDPSPFIFMQEPCSHRTVQLELPQDIIDMINLRQTGVNCGSNINEYVSNIFIEDN